MKWRVSIRDKARKILKRIPAPDWQRIDGVLGQLAENPFSGDAEKMKGEENSWRRRVGAYRIFYEIRTGERIVFVFRIERRTSKTY